MEGDDDCVIVEEHICEKSSTEIASLPSKEELTRVLECPVCYEIPFGPIVMCSTGHSLCRECAKVIDTCPICQSNYTNVRCLGLESIISMTKYECPNKNQGCDEILPAGGRFNIHTNACDYRDITCNESKGIKCSDTKVPFSNYICHLQENHHVSTMPGSTVIKQSMIPPLYSRRDWPYTCFIADNLTFLEKCKITDSVIYWWISVHSSKWTASQYIAFLVLSRDNTTTTPTMKLDKKEKISWKIPVLSIRDCVNEKSPEVAVYPLKDLLELCSWTLDKDGKKKYTWQLSISIQKIEKNEIIDCGIETPPKPKRPREPLKRRKSKKSR